MWQVYTLCIFDDMRLPLNFKWSYQLRFLCWILHLLNVEPCKMCTTYVSMHGKNLGIWMICWIKDSCHHWPRTVAAARSLKSPAPQTNDEYGLYSLLLHLLLSLVTSKVLNLCTAKVSLDPVILYCQTQTKTASCHWLPSVWTYQ